MKALQIIVFLAVFSVIGSCTGFQTLTLDNTFQREEVNTPIRVNSPGISHYGNNKGNKTKRKIIYDKIFNDINGWISCDKEAIVISQEKWGTKIFFPRALNDCFRYNFPTTDITDFQILSITAVLPDTSNSDIFDIRIKLEDEKNNATGSYPIPVYISHVTQTNNYLFDLTDFLGRNQQVNPGKINSIEFLINTIEKDYLSGVFIISHIEFLKAKE